MVGAVIPLENEFVHPVVPINNVGTALIVHFEKSRELLLHQIINKTNKAKRSQPFTPISEQIIIPLQAITCDILKYVNNWRLGIQME